MGVSVSPFLLLLLLLLLLLITVTTLWLFFYVSFSILNVDSAPEKESQQLQRNSRIILRKAANSTQRVATRCVLVRPMDHGLTSLPSVTSVLKTSVGIFMVETTTEWVTVSVWPLQKSIKSQHSEKRPESSGLFRDLFLDMDIQTFLIK